MDDIPNPFEIRDLSFRELLPVNLNSNFRSGFLRSTLGDVP